MKANLVGYAMLIGGPLVAVINALEWFRWRTGKPPMIGKAEGSPRSDMNRTIQCMELVGWTVFGLFLGMVGLEIVT